jgi:hypothetical protein
MLRDEWSDQWYDFIIGLSHNDWERFWIHHYLSSNSSITWNTIEKHRDEQWDWDYVCSNPSISWERILYINENIQVCDSRKVSDNVGLTWDIIWSKREIISWDWDRIAMNPNVTMNTILSTLETSEIPWNYYYVSMNPSITWDDIQKTHIDWDIQNISKNPNITWDIIQSNPNEKWCWYNIGKNPSITWDVIQSNSNCPWYYGTIAENPNITWDIIQSNPTLFSEWDYNMYNPNITPEIVLGSPDKKWDPIVLAGNSVYKSRERFILKRLQNLIPNLLGDLMPSISYYLVEYTTLSTKMYDNIYWNM